MCFRVLFAYALGRGLLDAITRRPHLEVRLARVRFLEAKRAMREAYRAAFADLRQAQREFEEAVLTTARAKEFKSRIRSLVWDWRK